MRPAKSNLAACVSKGYFVRAPRVSAACKSANGVNEPEAAGCLSRVSPRVTARCRPQMATLFVFRTLTMRFCLICSALLLALAGCSSVVHRQSPTSRESSVTAAAAKVSLRTKQFSAALRLLRTGAEHGDVQSEYLLGLIYANGLGTDVSDADARRWLRAAAEKSNVDAAYALAGLLAQGSREDRESARRWLERAAAEGQPLASKLVSSHLLPLAAARSASGDAKLARDLVSWAIRNDIESLGSFVKAAGVEATDEFGRSPLASATSIGSEDAVRQLLTAGASGDHADRFGVTPLMLAAEGASDGILDALLKSTKGVNARDSVGNTAL